MTHSSRRFVSRALRARSERSRQLATEADIARIASLKREDDPPVPRDAAKSVRSRLYWVAALLLAGAALLAGMLVEWMRPGPQGLGSPSTLLALAALGGSLVLGVSIARRMAHSPSASRNNAGDARAVLAFIWWPITVVSVAVPLFVVYISTQNTYGEGTGVPTGITLILGVFGFIILPAVVNESRAAFAGRGLRGFWRAAKNTPWGDGI